MKNRILTVVLLFSIILVSAQEKESLNLFETDSTWFKEIIEFPISFAQQIKFNGYEDLRFPPGWAKKNSPEFWSYMWAWSLNDIKELTEDQLEINMQLYFDGLMGIDGKKIPNTNALFIKKDSSIGNQYIGKVKTFDTRFTNKPMTLNVHIESHYCGSENKSIILFRLSPKDFNHSVWTTLNSVKLIDNFCKD